MTLHRSIFTVKAVIAFQQVFCQRAKERPQNVFNRLLIHRPRQIFCRFARSLHRCVDIIKGQRSRVLKASSAVETLQGPSAQHKPNQSLRSGRPSQQSENFQCLTNMKNLIEFAKTSESHSVISLFYYCCSQTENHSETFQVWCMVGPRSQVSLTKQIESLKRS